MLSNVFRSAVGFRLCMNGGISLLAIKNAKILTITQGIIEKGTVLIDGSRIVAVGESVDIPAGAEIIDGTGKVVMPGMIDAHGHAGVDEDGIGIEGWDYNESVDPVTPHLRALDGLNPEDQGLTDAYRGGVTAMCIVPGSANVIGGEGVVIHTYGRIVDEMIIKNSGGLKVAFGENPKRVYREQKKSPVTRMAIAALLRENLVKAQNYMKKLEEAKADPSKAPERDLKMETLVRVLRREIPLRAHAHRADDIMTAIRIAEEFNVRLVLEHCTEGHKIADEIARRGLPAIVGPSLTSRAKVELRDRSFTTPGVLYKAGVKVAFTMDHPVIPVQYLPVSAALAVRAGMPEHAAYEALTINPAEILGIDDRFGSIEVGKEADLVVWSGEPLDIRSVPEKVIIGGKIVSGE